MPVVNMYIVNLLNELAVHRTFVAGGEQSIDYSTSDLRVEIKMGQGMKLMIKIISVTDIGFESVRVAIRDSNDLLIAIEPLGVSENRKYEYWVNMPTGGLGVKIQFVR